MHLPLYLAYIKFVKNLLLAVCCGCVPCMKSNEPVIRGYLVHDEMDTVFLSYLLCASFLSKLKSRVFQCCPDRGVNLAKSWWIGRRNLWHCTDSQGISSQKRRGIVHIAKETGANPSRDL